MTLEPTTPSYTDLTDITYTKDIYNILHLQVIVLHQNLPEIKAEFSLLSVTLYIVRKQEEDSRHNDLMDRGIITILTQSKKHLFQKERKLKLWEHLIFNRIMIEDTVLKF